MTPQLWLLDDQQPKIVPAIEKLRQAALVSQEILRFLRDATDTLGLQFRALGPVELQFMGFTGGFEFDNLLQLAQLCDQSRDGSGAILSVLRYICCIGELLCHLETQNWIDLHNTKLYIIGLGNSSVAAAALTAAKNIRELHEISLEIISIVFRLALGLRRRACQIEEGPGHWSRRLNCLYEEELGELIRDYNKQRTSATRHIYVAEHSMDWLTICGPPSNLTELCSQFLHQIDEPEWSVPMHSAQNAAHLPRIDIESIVGCSDILQTPVSPLIYIPLSTDTTIYPSTSLRALILQHCDNICHHSLRIDAMVASIDGILVDDRKLQVVTIGMTHRFAAIQRALNERGIETEVLKTSKTSFTSGLNMRGGSEAIAIVSMAGRFPGSEDIPQFWDSLLSGKQQHQRARNSPPMIGSLSG